eukprot:COSAG01_NODE_4406_length_5056_cov_124.577365_9_plen_67_part_00
MLVLVAQNRPRAQSLDDRQEAPAGSRQVRHDTGHNDHSVAFVPQPPAVTATSSEHLSRPRCICDFS